MNWRFWKTGIPKLKERSLDEIKSIYRILFIDDKTFPLVEILKSEEKKPKIQISKTYS